MGHVGAPAQSSYTTSKHAVIGLTKSLGLEYAKDKIRVNALCAGYVNTALIDFLPDDDKQELASLHPMGRLGEPSDLKTLSITSTDYILAI